MHNPHATTPRARYSYQNCGHELKLFACGATDRQKAALREGEVELALLVEERLIVVCCRVGDAFGDAIPWCHTAAYNWNQEAHDRSGTPQEGSDWSGTRAWLRVVLSEAEGGPSCAQRVISLCPSFTAALHGAIRKQVRLPIAFSDYEQDQAGFDATFGDSWTVLQRCKLHTRELSGRATQDGEAFVESDATV